jgi:transcriptional regulator GlxA family with amidase domain
MRLIGVLALDGAFASGIGVIADLFALSNRFIRRQYADREDRGRMIEIRLLSLNGAPITMAGGRRLEVDGAIGDRQNYDCVYVAGFDFVEEAELEARLSGVGPAVEWLSAQRRAGALIAATGGAIALLAQAGLLYGGSIAAPWWLEAALKRRHPHLEIDPMRHLSESDGTICAAAMNGDMALGMRLVERLLSPNVANWIAKTALVERGEPGFPVTAPIDSADPLIGQAQRWLQERFAEKPRMADLASALGISERTLTRRFEATLGTTPLGYLQSVRIEVAKGMLARSIQKIERIAYLVGYSDTKFFTRLFQDRTGLSPSAFRRQARGGSTVNRTE